MALSFRFKVAVAVALLKRVSSTFAQHDDDFVDEIATSRESEEKRMELTIERDRETATRVERFVGRFRRAYWEYGCFELQKTGQSTTKTILRRLCTLLSCLRCALETNACSNDGVERILDRCMASLDVSKRDKKLRAACQEIVGRFLEGRLRALVRIDDSDANGDDDGDLKSNACEISILEHVCSYSDNEYETIRVARVVLSILGDISNRLSDEESEHPQRHVRPLENSWLLLDLLHRLLAKPMTRRDATEERTIPSPGKSGLLGPWIATTEKFEALGFSLVSSKMWQISALMSF